MQYLIVMIIIFVVILTILLLGENKITMTLIFALLFVYAGHIFYKVVSTELKRKFLKTGDICKVYIGERKFSGLVLKVNAHVDIWVIDRVIRFPKNEVYA